MTAKDCVISGRSRRSSWRLFGATRDIPVDFHKSSPLSLPLPLSITVSVTVPFSVSVSISISITFSFICPILRANSATRRSAAIACYRHVAVDVEETGRRMTGARPPARS